jgi:C4-dicarboxylate transporter DctM subunit
MNLNIIFLVIIGGLLLLLLSGYWIAFSLGAIAVVGFAVFLGGSQGNFPVIFFGNLCSYQFFAMPLFLLMGEILMHGKLSSLIFDSLTPMFQHIRGGLLHSVILTNAVFGAICGSSVAAAASISTVAIPELEKRNYDKGISYGVLAIAGTLAVMIPPSMGFIIYGIVAEQSIGKLFIAGIIPGLIFSGLLMVTVATWVTMHPGLAPPREEVGVHVFRSLVKIWPVFILVVIILGPIYMGICTPTEAAGVGVFGALLIVCIWGKFGWTEFKASVIGATRTMGVMGIVIGGGMAFSFMIAQLGLAHEIAAWLATLPGPPLAKVFQIFFLYLILGMFIDPLCMVLITVPIVLPLIIELGFDPIWFGVVVTLCGELACVTPPVGVTLYVVQSVSQDKFELIAKGALPFWITCFAGLLVLTLWPDLCLWLPRMM